MSRSRRQPKAHRKPAKRATASAPTKRTTRKPGSASAVVRPKKVSKFKLVANIAVGVTAVVVVGLLSMMTNQPSNITFSSSSGDNASTFAPSFTPVSTTKVVHAGTIRPTGFGELWDMPAEDRAKVDIARMNLIVAKGAPDARDLDIEANVARIDEWARLVAAETDRYMYMFHRDPGQYRNSDAYFRILTMITVLQQDLGVRYNPERAATPDFTRSQDLFVHGMIPSPASEAEGGTCVSMPVLYTAVARRLGYPVSLVTTKAHVFCRWEDDNERFNIEASGTGLNVLEDDHYKSWPFELTDAEVERFGYLESLDADESLAVFLASAGHMMADLGSRKEAGKIYNLARVLDPDNPLYPMFMRVTADQFAGQPSRHDAWASRLGATDRDKQSARQTESTDDMIDRISAMHRRNSAPSAPLGISGNSVPGVPGQPHPFNPIQYTQPPIPGG